MTLSWVFLRNDERIEIRRSVDPESTTFEVWGSEGPRTFVSRDRAALVAFHAGFEQALLLSGWTMARFEPERRSGRDRRAVARGTTDRRGSLALVWTQ